MEVAKEKKRLNHCIKKLEEMFKNVMANKNASEAKVKGLTTENGREKRTNKALSTRLITAERIVTKLENHIDEPKMEYQEILAQLEVLKKMSPGNCQSFSRALRRRPGQQKCRRTLRLSTRGS